MVDEVRGGLDPDAEEKLRALEGALDRDGLGLERLVIRTGNRLELVDLAAVTCFVSVEHHTYLYTADREHIADESLAALEPRLDGRFVRVHRSALAAVARIARVGEREVVLDTGRTLPLSRRARSDLLGKLRRRVG